MLQLQRFSEACFALRLALGREVHPTRSRDLGSVGGGGGVGGVIAIIAFLAIIYIFAHAAGMFQRTPPWLSEIISDPGTQSLIVIILVFGLIVWFVTREPGAGTQVGGIKKAIESVGEWFKP